MVVADTPIEASSKRKNANDKVRMAPSLKRRNLQTSPTSDSHIAQLGNIDQCSSFSSQCAQSVRINPMEVAEVQGQGVGQEEKPPPHPLSTPASFITRALHVCVAHPRESQNGFRAA